ncbi:hypothetical protein [Halomicrobium sp. IBSBa]|uniref:hypothetical protein n=1 Tax=Halomicrobium sp. IBSBa TaxID=2778916 RepID=UPI001FC92707|nr:hypothetical protein [Halomicrobium sp. IBSBa]
MEQTQVRSTLPEEATFRCVVDYIGAYAYWDLPSDELDDGHQDLEAVEDCADDVEDLVVSQSGLEFGRW